MAIGAVNIQQQPAGTLMTAIEGDQNFGSVAAALGGRHTGNLDSSTVFQRNGSADFGNCVEAQ